MSEFDELIKGAPEFWSMPHDQLVPHAYAMFALISKLDAENTKLRELVRDAWGNGHPDKSCGDCEIIAECNAEIEEARKKGNGRWNTRCLFERRIEDRMRELGVQPHDD